MFNQGDRVEAHIGDTWKPGIVNYRRMAAPDYRDPVAYSILLDEKANVPGYAGTMIKSEHVRSVPELSDDQKRTVEELGKIEASLQRKGWSMEEET